MTHAFAKDAGAKTLRQFGLTMAGALALMFGLVLPWLFGYAWPVWPWVAAVGFSALGIAAPRWLAPVYRAWMKFALVLGSINSRILLGLVFVIAFVPLALLFRLTGRDVLARSFDPAAPTYRVVAKIRRKEDMERPF